jgi:hypothetical protein
VKEERDGGQGRDHASTPTRPGPPRRSPATRPGSLLCWNPRHLSIVGILCRCNYHVVISLCINRSIYTRAFMQEPRLLGARGNVTGAIKDKLAPGGGGAQHLQPGGRGV